MNGYQRYTGVLQGKPVDFLPRTPILMQYAAEFINSDYIRFASDYNELVKANEECARFFGIDQLSSISDPYRETQGFGSEIEYIKNGPPRSTHPLQYNKDFSLLPKPDPLKSERMLDRVNAVSSYAQRWRGESSILGWVEGPAAEAADLRDVTAFLVDLLDDEAYASELMDICIEVAIEFAHAQVQAGADTVGIGDAVASLLSPTTYENLIQPREKRLVKAIQDMGAYVKLHICGDITHLLPGIADLGVDILDVDHMVDMQTVRDAVGKSVALAGNIDPVEGVQRGTPDEIKQKLICTYAEVGNPYVVNAGCEIPSGTPVENLLALCEPITYQS
jgi:MtaA/CmuA family methyltransferase